jgi:hypothetical protein
MMKCAALALLFANAALAERFVRVERKDWVADWSDWVMRSTVTATGKVLRFLSPGPRARREILLRGDFEAQLAAGMRKLGARRAQATADVQAAGPMKLQPLQVSEFAVDDQAVRGVELDGDSVLAFWTLSHDGKSVLYLQGRKQGRVNVRLSLAGGKTQQFPVEVP